MLGETEIAQAMLEIGAKFMPTESDEDNVDDNMCEKTVGRSYQLGGDEVRAVDKTEAKKASRWTKLGVNKEAQDKKSG